MKPSSKIQSWLLTQSRLGKVISMLAITFSFSSAWAATAVWTAGGTGNFGDSSKYTPAVAPVAGDTVSSDGAGSTINFDATNSISLVALNLNITSGATTFNQTAGNLTLGTLGFGGAGGSRNPVYNLSGGNLSISTGFGWGNGSNAKFNVSAGTADYTGTSLSIGVANGSKGSIIMTGGTLNANSVSQINLANASAASAQAVVDLSGSAQFNATASTFVIGQFGAATGTGVFATLNMAGISQLNTSTVILGGNNAPSAVYGVINLNGGTISTGGIRKGNGSIASSGTANVLHANGGMVKVVSHAMNSNYFLGTTIDLQAGGLNFDTDSSNATITNVMSGAGGFTKKGDGVLTLTGTNTYSGATTVTGGQLVIGSATVIPDANNLTISDGALVGLDGVQERVGSLTLGSTLHTASGTYGSSESGADFQDDSHFTGTGTILIGPPQPARNLAWSAAAAEANSLIPIWMTAGSDSNFINTADSSATIFHTGDTVAFNDLANLDLMQVTISGNVQPGGMVFNNTDGKPYVISSSTGGILGGGGLVKNGAGDVTVGGVGNTYSGAIAVNAGKLVMGSNAAFGVSSGIAIAPGAQVDINGKAPGSIYTYTVSGTGPGNTGIIVNSGAARFGDAGIKNLVMTGDASIGSAGNRFDFGQGGTVTGNNHTLTKVGTNDMGFRGDASGTPINIVVAGGTVWAEGTANAYGGSTGTLTIKSGARAGTYGTLSIATPVTIESGGTLHNQGVATGTWTGAFSLSGNVTIDSTGSPISIEGDISGTANITKLGTANVTIADPDHVGNTTVTSGQLTLNSATLNDAATVTLNGVTSKLSLPHGTSDTVSKFVLDGVQQVAGTYVSETNTQSIPGAIPTAHLIGDTGSLIVTSSPVVNVYDNWANANITNPAYSELKGRLDDPDGDGLTNINEFLYGSNPQAAGGSVTELIQSGSNLIVRWKERTTGATYTLQESATLAEIPWPASGVAPAVAVDQTGVPTDYTRKQATIPINSTRKFVRVYGVEN